MFQQYTSSGLGLADPQVIPTLQINHDFDANPIFSTISRLPFSPSSTTYPSSGNIDHNSLCIPKQGSLDALFGHVPTQTEVLKAMSDLQKLMNGLVQSESNTNQIFAVQNQNQSRTVQSPGYQRVLDAFHMLETEPSVKKMVLSISCDGTVWEAILKNESVQNLQGSVSAAKEENGRKIMEEQEVTNLLMRWIMGITKVKILDLIEGFSRLICEVFQPNGKEKSSSELDDLLEDKLRNSFLVSVVLLMIVIVTRNHGA